MATESRDKYSTEKITFGFNTLEEIKKALKLPAEFDASMVFETMINNESCLSNADMVLLFHLEPKNLETLFTLDAVGLRTLNLNPKYATSVEILGPLPNKEIQPFQSKFRGLLIKLFDLRCFEAAVKSLRRHQFNNKPAEEVIPNYKEIIADCGIKEDELIAAMAEYDKAIKEN